MKRTILFIVSDFYHGGAQREMYELDKVIDKEKVELDILCLSELNKSNSFPDYFYEKYKALKTNIIFLKDLIVKNKKSITNKILRKISKKTGINLPSSIHQEKLNNFLSGYDQVFFMGEYVYQGLSPMIDNQILKNIIIFIMSARFQGEHYRNFSKDNRYIFISPFNSKEQVAY